MPTNPKKPATAKIDLTLNPEEPSLLFAQRELIRTNGIDFDEWWNEFKVGFVNGKRDKSTNWKTKDWIKPKMVDITPTTSVSGARTIEFWLDKEKLETSYLLSGTTSDLINGIMSIMREKEGGIHAISGKGSKPLLRGYPCIRLLFASENGENKGIKQIRCVGYTADLKIANASKGIKLLSRLDVKRWSAKIKTIFGDKEYVWRKGISCVSYSGMIARLQGLEGYAYVKNEPDGINLFKAILQIFDATPDMDGFNFSEKTNESQFKKTNNEERIILEEKVKVEQRRPIADCKFISASLIIDGVKKPIPMVRGKVIIDLSDSLLN